jgi:TetR/AcrR family fatty acid metabolism transcriptional regulator
VRTKSPLQAEKILSVAARLFATHRFHEARMEDIAAAAGVGKGTIYRYFKDKDELFFALMAKAAGEMDDRLCEALGRTGCSRARLEAVVAAYVTYFDEHPHLFDLIHHAEAMHRPEEEFPWMRTRRKSFALVMQLFTDAAADGEFTVRDPDLAVLMLLGGLRAVIRFGARPRAQDLACRIVEDFLHGACAGLANKAKGQKAIGRHSFN